MQNRSFYGAISGYTSALCIFFLSSCQQQESAAPHPQVENESTRAVAPVAENAGKAEDAYESADQAGAKAASGNTAPLASASPNEQFFGSRVAAVGAQDSLRRLVRKANARFQVQNTLQASIKVEDIAAANGGFVLENHLNSEVLSRAQVRVSQDSLVETTRYQMTSQITLRVPVLRLDSALRQIGRLAHWVDYRHVSAEDVGMQYLEQELARLRQQQLQNDIRSAVGGNSRAGDRLEGAEMAAQARAEKDAARLQLMQLEDAIRFSTVQVDLYQSPQTAIQRMAVAPTLVAYTPPLGTRIAAALGRGWRLMESVFLGILQLWGVLLILGGSIWYYFKGRNFVLKPKTKKMQPGVE